MKSGLAMLFAVLALSGCNGDAKKDAGAGTAQGDVLPGAASDAMLPLDTVKSQAPLAPTSEGGVGSDKSAKPAKRTTKPEAKKPGGDAAADPQTVAPVATPSATP